MYWTSIIIIITKQTQLRFRKTSKIIKYVNLSLTFVLFPSLIGSHPSTFLSSAPVYSSLHLFVNLPLIPFIHSSTFYSSLLSIGPLSTHPCYISVNLPLILSIYSSTFYSSLLSIRQPSTHPSYISLKLSLILLLYPLTFYSFFLSVNIPLILPIFNNLQLIPSLPLPNFHSSIPGPSLSTFHSSLPSLTLSSSLPSLLQISTHPFPPSSYLSPSSLLTFHSSINRFCPYYLSLIPPPLNFPLVPFLPNISHLRSTFFIFPLISITLPP